MSITTENLIAVSDTPVAGQRVVKVAPGVWMPIGIGGNFVPGGGSSDYYKCTYASSDSSMSWRGRKAVLSNGIYTFQSNSTSGLTYGIIKPSINNVYADGALVKAQLWTGAPEVDILFNLTDTYDSISGASLSNQGVTFTSSYAQFDGQSYMQMPQTIYSQFQGISSIFFCGWFKLDSNAPSQQWLWAVGHGETDFGVYINSDYSHINMNTRQSDRQWGADNDIPALVHDDAWHFCAFYSKSGGAQFACIDTTYRANSAIGEFYSDQLYNGTVGIRDIFNSPNFLGDIAQMRFLFGETLDMSLFQVYCSTYKTQFTPPSA